MWVWIQNSDWSTLLQLLLDLLLLFLVIVLLWHRRRPSSSESAEPRHVLESFERILNETKALSEEFDRNLRDRGRLIQNVLEALDAKVSEARSVLKKLEELQGPASSASSEAQGEIPSKTLTQRILALADAGHSPQEIASRIHRSLGEVELILGLHKLQQKKSL
ncbi:MAG: hypothetical protein WHS46_02040 [Desulfosoma sp.]